MNDRCLWALTLALAIGALASCSRNETTNANIKPQDREPQGRVEQRSAVVTTVDRAGYDAALVSHKGQVVLVDCWATWCLPCLKQLPHSLALLKQHDDLVVLTLNFDDPSKSDQVAKTLTSKGGVLAGTHFISGVSGTQAMEDFEITSGALPHYKLYDRAGKLRRVFELDPSAEKQFTAADIDAAVAELVGEDR
jgi:thiol-disulfide isomerase/thioredoxin